MKTEPEYRAMTPSEKGLLLKLLELSFPGSTELRLQLSNALVSSLGETGSLFFDVRSELVAPVKHRVPVEAWYSDVDTDPLVGPFVRILLHVVAGKLFELEIYKDDGSAIIKKPMLNELRIFSPDTSDR